MIGAVKDFYNGIKNIFTVEKEKETMASTKFKVGDKVIIRKELKVGERYGGKIYSRGMDDTFYGMTLTIESADVFWGYQMKEDHFPKYTWTDEMLELASEVAFTKADLKDGMVVKYRNGQKALVIGDRFVSDDGYMSFSAYDDMLCRTSGIERKLWDIVKCYKVRNDSCWKLDALFDWSVLDVIWERKEEPEHKEMTVEEIEEKLGYKIKVVADK